jgi:hypothetical protein
MRKDTPLTYGQGFNDGQVDAKDANVPDMLTSFSMADYVGIREAEFFGLLGTAYVQGYLQGFRLMRPNMGAKGLLYTLTQVRKDTHDVRGSDEAEGGRQGGDTSGHYATSHREVEGLL